MKTAFHGEGDLSMYGSGLSGAHLQTPPPEDRITDALVRQRADPAANGFGVDAWMEVWDYAGGASFRAFVADDGKEKSLFVFFDIEGVMGRDLKKAYAAPVLCAILYIPLLLLLTRPSLMALIELADGPLNCAHIVTCLDRRIPVDEALGLTKSLQWVGFEMTTLDHWAHDLDVTSKRWVFMGMEL